MLFNSGTPSLVSSAQTLAGSPSGSQSPLFGLQEVKDVINDAYAYLSDLARTRKVGYGQKRAYADSTTDVFYELPDDFIEMVLVEVDLSGNNLSTVSVENADVAYPRFESSSDAFEMRGRALLSPAVYYFYHGGETQGTRHIGIVDPVETTGTKSLRLTYEATADDLSADTDEPMLPQVYHRLIAKRAAWLLRMQNDLPTRDLRDMIMVEEVRFQRAMSRVGRDLDFQIPLAGRPSRSPATRTGYVRRF